MKKTKIKFILELILILILLFSITNNVFSISNPDEWNPNPKVDNTINDKAAKILGWIQYIGIITAVIALTLIGLKYIFSSAEGKAEYKKTAVPYIAGCCLLMSVSLIVGVIGNTILEDSKKSTTISSGQTNQINQTTIVPSTEVKNTNKNASMDNTKCPKCGSNLIIQINNNGGRCVACKLMWEKNNGITYVEVEYLDQVTCPICKKVTRASAGNLKCEHCNNIINYKKETVREIDK